MQPGSAITLRVSKGQVTQVPNVVGQTLANAVQTLSSAGYTNLAVQGSRDPNSVVVDQKPTESTDTNQRIVLTTQSNGGGEAAANNGFGLLN